MLQGYMTASGLCQVQLLEVMFQICPKKLSTLLCHYDSGSFEASPYIMMVVLVRHFRNISSVAHNKSRYSLCCENVTCQVPTHPTRYKWNVECIFCSTIHAKHRTFGNGSHSGLHLLDMAHFHLTLVVKVPVHTLSDC